MRAPVLFTFFFSTVVILGIAHVVATEFFLYWKYWWFDMVTHTLGGVSVAFAVLLIPSFMTRIPKYYFRFVPVLSFVFVIGLCWELFEFLTGITVMEPGYAQDTISDLCMDIIGGTIGYLIGNRVRFL